MKTSATLARIALGIVVGVLAAQSTWAVEVITREDVIQGTESDLVKVADNAVFMLDASSSMNDKYSDTGQSRWDLVRKFINERNSSFPSLGYQVGIYLYTPWKAVYPFGPYDRERVATALETLPEKGKGPTPMLAGLKELEKILKNTSGKTAVFLFTDGSYTGGSSMQLPIDKAEQLVKDHDVCFYVVSTAKEDVNERLLEKVGALNACSRVIPFSNFIQNPTYTSGALYDVKATTVTSTKKTVVGLKVDDLTFRFDKAELRPEDKQELEEVVRFLKEYPESWVRIAGHTDNVGSKEVNLTLSRRRAEGVEQMLLSASIDQNRIVTQWYGAANPIASNDTPEGQALNRRVEIAVGTNGQSASKQ